MPFHRLSARRSGLAGLLRTILLLIFLLTLPLAVQAQERSNPVEDFVRQRVGDFVLEYHPADEAYANQVGATLLMGSARLRKDFSIPSFRGSRLVIAWDSYHFEELSGGHFPHWGAALARPEDRLIVMKSPRWANVMRNPTGTVMHEMVHLATGMLTNNHRIPIWLSEGIAVEESGEVRGDSPISMATAMTSGALMDLWELDGLHGFSSEHAGLAYLQAESAVIFFKERYGRFTLIQLLLEVGRGTPFEQAFDHVTAGGWYGFNQEYKEWARKRFGGYFIQDLNTWIWVGIVLLAGVAVLLRKLRARRIVARWEEEERLYGDPEA